ncbi:MAG TPA: hypothetical protein VFC82_07655 [Actinomycetaceae bacterium]|nr:hypothetical protein [Actinomycetaceae bacterium]
MKPLARFSAVVAVSVAMAGAVVTPAHAESSHDSDPYAYNADPYVATKISHPDRPVQTADGIVDFNGEPDRGQSYSWSAVGYGDDIYIGTCYGAVYQTIRMMSGQLGMDQEVLDAALKAAWNGTLFVDPAQSFLSRGVIVKINTVTNDVTVIDSPHEFTNYRSALEYEDKLYFASTMPSLVEIDPATDEARVVYSVPAPSNPLVSRGIRGLAEVNGELVSSAIGDDGAFLVSSADPSAGSASFRTIATQEELFDYPAYLYTDSIFGGSIWDIVEFDGKMYVTIVTGRDGDRNPFALVRGTPQADGSWSWEAVVGAQEDGAAYPFGLGAHRSGAANLAVFDDYLYVGGYNDPMIALPDALARMEFENLYEDLENPPALWKMDANEDFEMVAGEANELFPDGPTGNMGSGFGNNTNQYVWRMTEFEDQLFLGTFDVASLAYPLGQFANGDILKRTPEEWATQIQYLAEFVALLTAPEEQANAEFGTEEDAVAESATQDAIGDDATAGETVAEGAPDDATPDEAGAEGASEEDAVADVSAEDQVVADIATEMEEQMIEMAPALEEEVEVVDAATATERVESASAFHGELQVLQASYEQIRAEMPSEMQASFDGFLSPESISNFDAFIGVMTHLSKADRGFDLLVTEDGDNFSVITRNGFGDPYNHGLRVFAESDQGLGIGTANPFYGTQVWLLQDTRVEEPNGPADPEGPTEPDKPTNPWNKPAKPWKPGRPGDSDRFDLADRIERVIKEAFGKLFSNWF